MNIRISQNSGRRCAYTDRKNGYMELICAKEADASGYYREDVKFLDGFSVGGHPFNEAKSVNASPEGVVLEFDSSHLEVSLLIDEQAFFLSGAKNCGILGLNARVKKDSYIQKPGASYSDRPFEESFKPDAFSQESGFNSDFKTPASPGTELFYEWKQTEKDGVQILSTGTGIAIAASFDFYFKINDSDVELYAHDSAPEGKGWYLVMENSDRNAVSKAVRLVKEDGIKAHCKKIQDFLGKCSFDSGDKNFDDSVQWARFNAWLLAVQDPSSRYRGIWAGLPWFRDNWGRDTFIALCGTLLVSGCFDEAKSVLLGFAGFQDLKKSSATYGRIPNRYRNPKDVIYNTADGTLWFVRALWEYVQYSGDTEILEELSQTVETALDSDISRSDGNGFLKHGDADTWMDARIMGNQPWSARGDRANDIQALWYTALKLGSYIMEKNGKSDKGRVYDQMAEKVKKSFERFFWNADCEALADHLDEGGYGEWAKDMRVRPNQLFAITAPKILPKNSYSKNSCNENSGMDEDFVNASISKKIMQNVDRELVNPFGLYSLSPEDPIFHPEHENPAMHNKDAAYHNGTIWEWNSGPYITAASLFSGGTMPKTASGILQNESKMILETGCAGSLSENIHANPDEDGNPKLSGTFSQAWSLSEYVRNIAQDLVGFVPKLCENRIILKPCLPYDCKQWKAVLPFGNNWSLDINIERQGKHYDVKVRWLCSEENSCRSDAKAAKTLTINEDVQIAPNGTVQFRTPAKEGKKSEQKNAAQHITQKFSVPKKWITEPYPVRNLSTEWCGAQNIQNYLENVILSGRMKSRTSGGENTACLEWYFDSASFREKYTTDEELGAIYTKTSTVFRIWAPTARSVALVLYPTGNDSDANSTVPMKLHQEDGLYGVWETEVQGDLHGVYYEYRLLIHGVYNHSPDPYARAVGLNGNRSMVVDMERTNPDGWKDIYAPGLKNPNDAVVWEVHVADLTSSKTWNGPEEKRRLYTGAVQEGTSYRGFPTGFDYIKSLGVTHVQLLPIFDFRSVDEARTGDRQYSEKPTFGLFNWGYDPQNYGAPEGSYSSNPYDACVRIKELKTLVQSFAKEGIGVVMDVVFNHVNDGLHQSLGISVPGYFFRVESYSGAGEDTASEREMFKKYMVKTLCFWLREYKLSGFRFDLMGLHDVCTMNEISAALRKIKKDVLIYGEGWQMYNAGKMIPASMVNAYKMTDIGHFNDAFRCAVKGPLFDDKSKGFIHDGSHRESVKFGITGATLHPQMDFSKVDGTANPNPWTQATYNSINYTEIHDNITLNDKLRLSEEGMSEEYYEQLGKMAISLVLLSEGLPVLHAGMEFLRTKEIPKDILDSGAVFYDVAFASDGKAYLRNSYNVCDRINGIDWSRAHEKHKMVEYTQKLILLRKNHPAFRIPSGKTLADALVFLDCKKNLLPKQVLAWKIDGSLVNDCWKKIIVCANPLNEEVPFNLPSEDSWFCVTDGITFSNDESYVEKKTLLKAKTVSVFASK